MATSPEQMEQSPPSAGFSSPAPLETLRALLDADNVAELLDESSLQTIGQRCVREYKVDLDSRSEWEQSVQAGLKLAKQVKEEKSFPWPGAANVKFPLLAEAAISFAARAYPELVKGKVVKASVTGKDPQGAKAQRAERVSEYLSWQVLSDMPYWESETDQLLVQLPLIGNAFRKTYHDPVKGTCDSRLVPAMDFVVNHNAKCLENVRRESEYFEFYGNDVLERQRSGAWRDVSLNHDAKEGVPDEDKVYKFIEQHRWLDLDEDGYEEPYIATVHIDSGTVVRIVPRFTADDVVVNGANEVVRITASRFYTHYIFMPNPDGGLYAMGLCMLLLPISESINTTLNQLLDAGTMHNTSGGFISKGIRIKGGTYRFTPNEWKTVDSGAGELKNSIVPLPVKEPSAVLFQLLGLLIESGRGLANLKDVLQGELPQANTPATTVLAMIEQGEKVYNGIYKRVFRSLGEEFKAIFRENRKYLKDEKYQAVLDQPAIVEQDFNESDFDVTPVADPNVSSQVQRMYRAQAMMQIKGEPGMKGAEVTAEYLESIGIDSPDRFFDPASQAQAQMQMSALAQVAAEQELAVKAQAMAKTKAEIKKITADALHSLAQAEAAEEGTQIGQLRRTLEMIDAQLAMEQVDADPAAGRVEGMAGPPGDQMVPMGAVGGVEGAPGLPGGGELAATLQ